MPEITQIARVRASVESTFATDRTSDVASNFFQVRADSVGAPRWSQEQLPSEPLRSFRVQRYVTEHGFTRGQVTIEGDLVSTGVELNKDATATKDSTSKLLEQMIGGYQAGGSAGSGAGSLVASGASSTGVTVTAAQGARFDKLGIPVAVETASASGLFEVTEIKTVSTDALTFTRALTFTPAVGAKVINAQVLYPTDQPTGTLQWLVEHTRDRDNIFLYLGCQGTVSLTWALGQKVRWSTQQQVTKILHDDEITTPQGGGSMSVYTLDGGSPVIARAGAISFNPSTATTRVAPNVAELTIDLGIAWIDVPSFNGTEGRAGFEQAPGAPSFKIKVPHADETYKDALVAQTPYRLIAQAGNVGGRMLAFCAPYCQIVEIAPTQVNGLEYDEITCIMLADASLADQSDDMRRRPYALARF